ncbi:hypothetical protein ABBQ38_007799 [Trebouxia sp. C0009 RCD-2024]
MFQVCYSTSHASQQGFLCPSLIFTVRHNRAVYNGGARMLFSRAAFHRVAAAMFTNVTSSKFGAYGGTQFVSPTDYTGWPDPSHNA